MEILSHRGYWLDPSEKNQRIAFERSFDLGFGTETDVRDHGSRLVISHDPATGSEMSLDDFLDILGDRNLPLALNIKADGLGPAIRDTMAKRSLTRWFTFDMSGPELIRQKAQGLPAFTRQSEYETQPVLYDRVQGLWLDGFDGIWFEADHIRKLLSDGKQVCIVSPELHGRTPTDLWDMLEREALFDADLMVCTDIPEALRERVGEAA